MTSTSLGALQFGVDEVKALRRHYPVRTGLLASGGAATAAKAHGRACVVLLSSHFERYLYSVNEEAVEWLNLQRVPVDRLPMLLRLQHSQGPVDELAKASWERREKQLRAFVASDAELWTQSGVAGSLEHRRLLTWMKAPKPDAVVRVFRQYGIEDVFDQVTRTPQTRRTLYLDIKELVEKRNNIAHGDTQTEALPGDVSRYLSSVSKLATSADGLLGRALKKIAQSTTSSW